MTARVPRFRIRNAESGDVSSILHLARQAPLLNLPPDKEHIQRIVRKSLYSFQSPDYDIADAVYLFVLDDLAIQRVLGCSLIFPSCLHHPQCFLKIQAVKPEMVLRMGCLYSGYSAIGGLVVDETCRGTPWRAGKKISLVRFLFMGLHPERFEPNVFSELMAPVDDQGRNSFWDKIGKPLTGMSYHAAFEKVQQNDTSFLEEIFPEGDIRLTPEQAAAHMGLDNVLECGKPEQRILEQTGFHFLHQINPMDGALQYGCPALDISIIRQGCFSRLKVVEEEPSRQEDIAGLFPEKRLTGALYGGGIFRAAYISCRLEDDILYTTPDNRDKLDVPEGTQVFSAPLL